MHLLYSFLSSLWALLSLPLIHQDRYQVLQWQGDTPSPLKKHTAEELVDAEVEIRQDDSARRHPASPHSSNTQTHSPNQKGEVDGPLPDSASSGPVQPLCAYCRSLTLSSLTSPTGYAFHQTLSDIRASSKDCGDGSGGCRLCEFLLGWSTGIVSPDYGDGGTEWTLFPWGRFNGIFRVSQVAQEQFRRLQKGRLYAIEVFEGVGRGLVGMFDQGRDRQGEDKVWFYFALRIGEGEGCDKLSDLYRIPVRRPLTNTGSISSFATAKRWLAVCDASHDCQQAQLPSSKSNQSPASRLLDVQAFDQPCLDVRLVETWEGEDTSQYIALSHRWGTKSQPMTTKHSTLQERRSRIPFASLPLTFRHAVQVTRDLGVRYLWIDSLCIIQDSAEDWEIESGRMGAIYMNSYVTLAADSSRSSDAGLFNTQSVLQDEAPLGKHLRLDVSTGDTGGKKGSRCNLYISSEFGVPKNIEPLGPVTITHDNDEDEDDPDESLVKRGWTLQEAVLPPRVLHFTSKQLIWECSQTGYEAEDTFSLNLRFLRPSFTEMKAKLMPQLENGEGNDFFDPVRGLHASEINILRAWYLDLIEFRYSGRRLTYGTDKLPAISGLADLASRTLDCEYIGGMWKKGIEWALTWRTLKAEAFTAEKKRQPYRCPSFSWACSNSLFAWFHALETFQPTAKVEDMHVELRSSRSPFGCLREGCHIRIAGWVSQQAVASHYDRRNALHFRIGGKRTGKIHMDRVLDDTETGGQAEPCSVVCIELGFGTGPNLQTGFVETQPIPKELCLLVLTPIQGESECYTRFGYGELSWDEKSEDCVEYVGSREWRTITIY